ncbi:AAA family ATPase [Leuconostoc carnosum]|uniref:AAA family ATPase n=1 Tax=Leuconostoc carnosum TaxID=1252 RepID=UPI0012390F6F|nr:AAA family ATPase [Leuconostoc carnosum]KAA8327814.1 hypothetical protein FE409_07245 [Leuconostoc carnosum]KAA8368475.1 hypothetical protein FE416_01400 [Leuconostoc carnosum]KAA8369824.1 hypothetical protein FE414_07245 [Leuconostoc carnosum]KAA8375280.1 hypothetical protein FE408_07300 [Leuconostoc carnosum]
MAIKISKFQEVKLQKPAPKGIAVYGEPMSGKTTFAGNSDKPLFLSFDGNADNAGYNAFVPKTFQDIMDVIEEAPNVGYKTLVIDTAEDMATLLELEVLENHNATSLKAAGEYGAGFGEFNKMFSNVIHALTTSPMTVYYLLRANNDEEEGLVVVLKPKLFNIIGGYSDALIEINNKHEAKWKKRRYDWDDSKLPEPLNKIANPEKEKAKKLAELGL